MRFRIIFSGLGFFAVVLFSFASVFAQDTVIVFDRPGVADAPYIVPEKIWQIESGISYADYFPSFDAYSPNLMLRKRLGSKNELRVTMNYEPQFMDLIQYNYRKDYFPLAIGMKQKLFKENTFLPEAALMANFACPVSEVDGLLYTEGFFYDFYLLFQNNLSQTLSLNYNVGALVKEPHNKGDLAYSFCINWALFQKVSFFGEGFGYYNLRNGVSEWGADGGMMAMICKDMQIDISHIINNYKGDYYSMLNIGFSKAF